MARASRHVGKHIISTALEHSSVSGTLTALQERGYEIDLVDIDREGRVDLEHLRELMRKDTVMVAVCAVDSELGTVQPLAEIAEIVRQAPDCRLHVDATQAVGKMPVSFDGIDTMSIAPHKFYGLNGCGILVKRKGVILEPLIHGGASTTIYRSGTPALALAASMETALQLALEQLPKRQAVVQAWNNLLRERLSRLSGGAHKQPETGDSAYFKFERARRQGRCVSAGAGRQGCLCIRQIRLFRGKYAVQSGVCRQS